MPSDDTSLLNSRVSRCRLSHRLLRDLSSLTNSPGGRSCPPHRGRTAEGERVAEGHLSSAARSLAGCNDLQKRSFDEAMKELPGDAERDPLRILGRIHFDEFDQGKFLQPVGVL